MSTDTPGSKVTPPEETRPDAPSSAVPEAPAAAPTDPAAVTSGELDDAGEVVEGEAVGLAELAESPAPALEDQARGDLVATRQGLFGNTDTGDTSGFRGLQVSVVIDVPTERPYGGWFDEVVDILAEVLEDNGIAYGAAVRKVVVDRGELTLEIAREHLVTVCRLLRDEQDLRFDLSLGVSGVHYPEDAGRELHAVYHLRSITNGPRLLRLEVAVPDADPHVPSTTNVYPVNDWHERETWDFFGIIFDGHPGLARIAMPDDWVGHPQRKDYPLGGIPVEYKGATVPPADQRRSYR
ncbi:MAG: NADH-quinone oxidoreductase subunit C [Salana multivorans]|nr:NADH-quinone oxidoreductase subunit C [Salana multivorans]